MPRPAVYLRVSTDQQREKVSISSQEDVIFRWLLNQGYENPYDDVLWYRDDGISGETPITSRGDGARLVGDIRAGVVGGFVATFSVSRISREASDFFAFRRLLHDHNLILIGISEGASTADEGGDMAVSINALFADWSNKALRKASKAGLLRSAREGKWMSRPPYGYRIADQRLVIYEEEAALVRSIFKWYTEDVNMGAALIAHRLNDLGISSPGKSIWQTNIILRILHNPVYMGKALYNRATTRHARRQGYKPPSEYITIDTPAIVSEAVYNRAQKQLALSAKVNARNGRAAEYALLNRVRCAICDRNYYRHHAHNRGYYRHDFHDGRDKQCSNPVFILSVWLDGVVWQYVVDAVHDPEAWLHQMERRQHEPTPEQQELAQVLLAMDDTALQLERLEEAYIVHGTMTSDRYGDLARRLRDKDERLRLRAYELREFLQATEQQHAARQSTADALRALQATIDNADDSDRAYAMDRLIAKVYYDGTGDAPVVSPVWF